MNSFVVGVLCFLCTSASAVVGISYSAPGDPTGQKWTADIRGIIVRDITHTINKIDYPAWEFDSLKDQKGWYLNTTFDESAKKLMQETGWTWTYISLTKLAPAAGYHTAKFRDGNRLWEVQLRQSKASGNGVWLHFGAGKYKQLKRMNLDDGFHIVQVTCAPANPGSYDNNDLITFYVNGEKVHEMRRRQQELTTGVIRGEILDEAIGGPGNFAVKTYRIDTGVDLSAYLIK
ncbi:MAG: hypothetical protein WC959_02340 [Kiritimatiellales bacterium]